MSIRLYGETRIATDAGDVSPGRAKERALLALLALKPNEVVLTEHILEALWPDNPASGRGSLRVRISNVRKQLGDVATIESVEGGYRLNVDDGDIDIRRFASLVSEASATADPGARRALLAQAVDIRTSEPLLEHTYDDFAQPAIDRDSELVALAARLQADLDVSDGRIDDALVRLADAIARRPADERLVAARMELLADNGRVADAVRAFAELTGALAERGLVPSADISRLEERILMGESAAASTLPPRRELWGRALAIGEVEALLTATRIVNVIGPPGVGKTSVALDVAHHWPGPVTWVSLVDASAADVARMASAAFDAVSSGDTLVVLDNCEHVRGAVSDLLNRPTTPRLLLTSRVAIDDEQLYSLDPLPVPTALDSAEAHEAAISRIFARRARSVDATFDLSEHLDAVLAVCDALDGLPLAIELAASRVAIMTPAEIADRLHQSVDVPSRIALPTALEGAIRWSIGDLSEDARALLARLSVCAGSFDLEMAEALTDDPAMHERLAELVAHSLVQRDETGRFSILSPVAAVAADLDDDLDEAHNSHGAFVASLVAPVADVKDRARFLAGCARLDADAPNVRAAIERMLHVQPELAARMLAESWRWWHGSGRWTDGAQLYRRTLWCAVPADREQRFAFLNAACRLLLFGGGPEDLLFEVLDDVDGLADALGRPRVRDVRGLALRMADRLDESIAVHEIEARELRSADVSARAALANVAAVRVMQSDLQGARQAALEAISDAEERGEAEYDTTPVTLAEVEFLDGEFDRAAEVAEAWLAGAGQSESGFRCEALQIAVLAHLERDRPGAAARLLPDLIALGVRLRGTHLAMVLVTAAVAARVAGRDVVARDLVATAAASDDVTPRPHTAAYMSSIGVGTAVPVTDALRSAYDVAQALSGHQAGKERRHPPQQ